jgi:hypothetical protein
MKLYKDCRGKRKKAKSARFSQTFCGRPGTLRSASHSCAVDFHAFSGGGLICCNCRRNRPHGGPPPLSVPSPHRKPVPPCGLPFFCAAPRFEVNQDERSNFVRDGVRSDVCRFDPDRRRSSAVDSVGTGSTQTLIRITQSDEALVRPSAFRAPSQTSRTRE